MEMRPTLCSVDCSVCWKSDFIPRLDVNGESRTTVYFLKRRKCFMANYGKGKSVRPSKIYSFRIQKEGRGWLNFFFSFLDNRLRFLLLFEFLWFIIMPCFLFCLYPRRRTHRITLFIAKVHAGFEPATSHLGVMVLYRHTNSPGEVLNARRLC